MRLAGTIALAVVLGGCGDLAPLASLDGGPMPLACTTPMSIDLVAPTSGTNVGVPMAGIAWTGGRCVMVTDEHAVGLVLLVADFTGTIFGGLTATGVDHWVIATSSTGSGPTSYLPMLPRDTDITVEMDRGSDRVGITFRVSGQTLVLQAMHRL